MPKASPLVPCLRLFTQAATPLIFAAFAFISGQSTKAQTLIPLANKVAFAKSSEVAMEGEGTVRLTVIRSEGLRGKFEVDVIVKSDPNKIASAFTGTKLTFNDYQLSASFTVPISATVTNTNGLAKVSLTLTNAVLVPGQNPAYTPVIGTPSTLDLSVYDSDAAKLISFVKVNYSASESTTTTNAQSGEIRTNFSSIVFDLKLGKAPDPAETQVTVGYDIAFTPAAQFATGADAASAEDIEREWRATNTLSGTITFDSQGLAKLTVPIAPDDLVEFDEEFIVTLKNPTGDLPDPASTNMPPDRIPYVLNAQKCARGRIFFNTPPAGAVDVRFNPDNIPPLQLRHPGANGPVTALDSDLRTGKYFVAGNFTAVDAITRHGLARLNTNGTVDASFVPAQNVNGAVTAVDIYDTGPRQGQVVLGGGFSAVGGQPRNSVARYLTSGALDLNFNIGIGANGPVYAVKTEGDNSVIIAGDFTFFDGVARNRIARLLPDGSLDPNSFNGRGANGPIFDLAIEVPPAFTFSANRTNTTNSVTIPRGVNSKVGVLELTYNTYGFDETWVVQFGQSLVLVTNFTNPSQVITNTADNSTSTNYLPKTITLDLPLQAQAPNTLLITVTPDPEADTNIVSWKFDATVRPLDTLSVAAVGDFTEFDQVPVNRVVKTDELGNVNDAFASNIGTGSSGPLLAVDMQMDGSYIIGGAFASFNSQTVGNIARLSSDGVFDETFAAGTGANGAVRDILVDRLDRTPDRRRWDKIYIGGDFTQFNGSRRIFLARLAPEGYLDTTFMDSTYNQFAGFPSVSGFAPDGTIGAITVGQDPGPVVGGIFDLVGGGGRRDDVRPRQNFARLVGNSTDGPGNFTFSEPIFGADEDGDFLTAITSTINQGSAVSIGNVAVRTVDQSAIAGQDYKGLTNVWTGAGPITVQIIDDSTIEGDEEFLITTPEIIGKAILGGEPIYPEFAYGPIPNTIARIVENDVPPAVFSFSQPEYNVDENRGTASIEIFRTGNIADRVTVSFSALVSTNANAASDPADFIAVNGQIVTFPSGVTNVTVTVPIRDDQIVEVDETVALAISGATGGGVVNTNLSKAVLNIVDNDLPAGKIDFTFGGFTTVEGELNAVVTAVRTGGNVGFITVDYATSDGTAVSGQDYSPRSGQLRWNDRDISTQTILIPIADDALVEAPEQFTVSLLNPSQPGVIGTRHPTTTVTINDNDFFGTLEFSAPRYFADENGVGAIIQVVRRNGSADAVSVNYATAPGTNAATAAVVGKDYNNVSGTLSFGPGETTKTFTVPIADDTDPDGSREVRLTLSSPVKATLGTNAVATLTIIDNETENIPAGGVDTDFVTDDGANGPVNVVAIHAEGTNNAARKILIAGEFTLFNHISRQHIARLNNDGTLDRNFAVSTEIDGTIRTMLVLPDGKIMIGGHFNTVDGTTIKRLARLNAVGHLDNSFQTGAGPDNAVFAQALTFAGNPTNNLQRILIGGDFVTFDSQSRQRIAMVRPDGTLDPNFNPGVGPNNSVYAIAVQRDQKILIGGQFISVGGIPRPYIARLNTDGTLDSTFDPGEGFDGAVHSIVVQPDDKILVGGNFTTYDGTPRGRVARLLQNGDLDSTFNPGTGADAIVTSIVVEADGKILVGGDFGTFNGAIRRSIVRLLQDGAVDLSINFGSGPNGVVSSIAVQSDRGILIGGDFTEVDGFPRHRVARLFGGSFAGSGAVEFAFPAYSIRESGRAVTVEIRRTGGLEGTVSATYETVDITAKAGEDYTPETESITFQPGEVFRTISIPILDDFIPEANEMLAVRLRDAVGGVIGRQPVTTIEIISDDSRFSLSSDSYVVNENAAGARANITIVREGISSAPVTVALRTSDGTAVAGSDYTSVNIPVTFAPDENVKVVAIPLIDDNTVEGDETVNLSLTLVSPSDEASIGRGSATLTIVDDDEAPGTIEILDASAPEKAGTITITFTRSEGQLGAVTANYVTEDATATAPFDYQARSGSVTFQQTDTVKTIVIPIEQDEEVEGNETFLVRITSVTGGATLGKSVAAAVIVDDDTGPGSLDVTFNTGTGAAGTVYSVRIQPDGKIVAGGAFTDFNNEGHPKVVRLWPDGHVDTNFSNGNGPAGTVYAVDLSDQGRIVIGGDFRSVNSIDRAYYARLTPVGGVDSSTAISPVNDFIRTLVTQPDFKTVIGGGFTSPANRAGRVLVNGAFDVSFNVGAGANDEVLDAQLQADGKVIFGGAFTQFGGLPRGHLVRVLVNGLVDPTFDTTVGADGNVNAVLPMPDGRILVAGSFTHFNGATAPRIVMLTTNGVVDPNFSVGTGPDDAVFALALQADGKILIGGDFANVNGQPRQRVARLNANGSLDSKFKPGLGPDGRVYDIDIQPDGQIVIAGAFNTVNGFPRRGIARLNAAEPPILIKGVSLAGSDIVISFESDVGVVYEIEGTSDLGNKLSWTTVKTATGNGSITQVTIPINAGYQFFRVKTAAP